jgi:hypothetical protein
MRIHASWRSLPMRPIEGRFVANDRLSTRPHAAARTPASGLYTTPDVSKRQSPHIAPPTNGLPRIKKDLTTCHAHSQLEI